MADATNVGFGIHSCCISTAVHFTVPGTRKSTVVSRRIWFPLSTSTKFNTSRGTTCPLSYPNTPHSSSPHNRQPHSPHPDVTPHPTGLDPAYIVRSSPTSSKVPSSILVHYRHHLPTPFTSTLGTTPKASPARRQHGIAPERMEKHPSATAIIAKQNFHHSTHFPAIGNSCRGRNSTLL